MSERDDDITLSRDGAATMRLRELEKEAVVSRRGVLWRAGLATAGGVAALTALDEQRAQADTGGNFILGQTNNASNPTILVPYTATSSNPLMQIDGGAMNATATSLIVKGPAGGAGLVVDGFSSGTNTTVSTIGLAIWGNGTGGTGAAAGTARGVVGSSGSNNGVEGDSTSGTGVWGHSSSGAGVLGQSTSNTGVSGSSTSGAGVSGSSSSGTGVNASSTSGTALSVTGKVHFSRSGSASVSQGSKTKTVNVSGMKSTSLVLVTLQSSITGVYVAAATPAIGKFTVHLNKSTPAAAKFAWFVLSG